MVRNAFTDKKIPFNKKDNEWELFETVRHQHFLELSQGITKSPLQWDTFKVIPLSIAKFHIKDNSIGVFTGDITILTIIKNIFWYLFKGSWLDRYKKVPEISDNMVEHIFHKRFGGILLNKINHELEFDSRVFLKNCQLVGDVVPCKVNFKLINDELKLTKITNYGSITKIVSPQDAEWRLAKANLMANAVTVFHISHHLTHQHIWMENVFAKCIKYLSVDHWIYKLLSPIIGDTGLINRTWGLYTITGLKEDHYALDGNQKEKSTCIADSLFISRESCHQMIKNAKNEFSLKLWPILDEYTKQLFTGYKNFVDCIVEKLILKDFVETEQWFIHTFGLEFNEPKTQLKQQLTNLLFRACPEHDRSHDDFNYYNHKYMPPNFKIINNIPHITKTDEILNATYTDGLNPIFSSNPESCWKRFCNHYDCNQPYMELKAVLKNVKQAANYINQYGSLTH